MKRSVYLGIGEGGLWLAMAGEHVPAGATPLLAKDAKLSLRRSLPPMAHPSSLHAVADIAEAVGYPFHGAMGFDELPFVLDELDQALKEGRLVAYLAGHKEGGGKAPAPPPPQPKPPAPLPTVNPQIEPATLTVVVRKFARNPTSGNDEPYTTPTRQQITLKTDAAFDGTATFGCDKPASLRFWSAASGGTEVKINGTDNVFPPGGAPAWAAGQTISGGVKLFVEGATPSAKKDDITLSLSLSGGTKKNGKDDTTTVTSVEVTIDICKSRTAAQVAPSPPTDPDPMSKDDKIWVGRFLHKQDGGKNHGRALVIVQAVQPTDFVGDVEIKAIGGVAFFDKDLPPPGTAVGADPAGKVTFKTADLKKKPGKVWVEATAVSGAPLRDLGVQADLKGVQTLADKCAITGVQFTQIKATVKATPATPANPSWAPAPPPHAGFPTPIDHELIASSPSEDFTVNPPLPLLRNAQPDIALELTATPAGLPIKWDVIRNPQDNAALGAAGDIPHLTPDTSGNLYKQTLNADNKGSFRVRPYIDCNGSTHYEDREPSIPLNLILFDVVVSADRSVAQPGVISETINATRARVGTGVFPPGPITAADLLAGAMAFDLDVDVTGGGADGKLGLTDYLFCGLCNNQYVEHADGAYVDTTVTPNEARSVKSLYASNFPAQAGALAGRRIFIPGDPAPALFNMPLLDSGRYPGGSGGLGGDSAVMSSSDPYTLAAVQPAVGERWTIQCIDSPGNGFPRRHPLNANSILQRYMIDWQFVGNFVFWTDLNKTRGSGGGAQKRAADRVYSVVRTQRWQTKGEWTADYTTTPPTFTRVSYTATNAGTTISPVGRAQDNAVQVRPPATVSDPVLGEDAREVVILGGGGGGGGGGCSMAPSSGVEHAGLFVALVAGVFLWRRRASVAGLRA